MSKTPKSSITMDAHNNQYTGASAHEKAKAGYRDQAHAAEHASAHAIGREGHMEAMQAHQKAGKTASKLGYKGNAANHERKAEFHRNSANNAAG